MFKFDPMTLDFEFYEPCLCSISLGGSGSKSKSKSKSSSQSGTKWNSEFMKELEANSPRINYVNRERLSPSEYANRMERGESGDFEIDRGPTVSTSDDGQPQFNLGMPRFEGLEDMDFDKLEKGLYTRQLQNIDPSFDKVRARTREELSQSGLLNSPVQYSKGGVMDELTENYLTEARKAATDASNKTIELKARELARKTGFDIDIVKLFQTIIGQYADVALRAGQFGESQSSSKGSSASAQGSIFKFGGSDQSAPTSA